MNFVKVFNYLYIILLSMGSFWNFRYVFLLDNDIWMLNLIMAILLLTQIPFYIDLIERKNKCHNCNEAKELANSVYKPMKRYKNESRIERKKSQKFL